MNYTPDEIAELLKDKPHQPHYIAAMVRKAVEAERERCAKICDPPPGTAGGSWEYYNTVRATCAAAIRAS